MKNNLEPRAKIGDEVSVTNYEFYGEFGEERIGTDIDDFIISERNFEDKSYGPYYTAEKDDTTYYFTNKDILKNLTTNTTYGKE
jgi:hypothetical protein